MYKASFVVLVLTLASCCGQNEIACSADGGQGVCKLLTQCTPVYNMLTSSLISQRKAEEVIEYVKSLRCGAPGEQKICCKECYTPDGEPGVCKPLHQCDHLVDKLVKKDLNYVLNSRCSTGTYQVCCGARGPGARPARGDCAAAVSAFPPDPSSGCCGLDASMQNKIFGGGTTKIDDYPWLALLEYQVGNTLQTYCGGSLISGKYVLTAAHCVVARNHKLQSVRLGEYDIENEGRDSVNVASGVKDYTDGAISVPVEQIIVHPGYDRVKKVNDIALLRLKHMVNYTDFIRPICLPASDISLRREFASMTASVAGWGRVNSTVAQSRFKQHVQLPLVTLEECRRLYEQNVRDPATVTTEQVCAGGEAGKDSCKGDSGGPLMMRAARGPGGMPVAELVGVINYGSKFCGQRGVPAVHASVFHHAVWIRAHLAP
ncbi:hypothetical protein ACJJTC_005701 [Scirpophaga incertulas]